MNTFAANMILCHFYYDIDPRPTVAAGIAQTFWISLDIEMCCNIGGFLDLAVSAQVVLKTMML